MESAAVPSSLYREFFVSSPVGFGISDARGVLIDFNEALRTYGGWSRKEVLDFGSVTALYYDGPSERDRLLGIARDKGSILREEVRFKRKDGGFFWAAMSLRPVKVEGQDYWLAVIEDVTAAKAAREDRERQLRDLEEMARLMIDREERMLELKRRIAQMENGAS